MHNNSLPKPRLLLAEDDPINRDVATRVLTKMHCRIFAAENGKLATELFACQDFDLVLMDCEMPVMNGYEATQQIRKFEQSRSSSGSKATAPRHTPIVALTADPDGSQNCLACGMDDFLVKPFRDVQMKAMLARWVSLDMSKKRKGQNTGTHGWAVGEQQSGLDLKAIESTNAFKGANGQLLFRRVVARFCEQAPEVLDSVRKAYGSGDAEQLRSIAHTLKSSSALLGARALSQCCAEVEVLARAGDVRPIGTLIAKFETEYCQAVASLTSLLGVQNEPPGLCG